jgi:hypothetical protein
MVRRWNLDEEAEVWDRNGPIKVVLKRFDNSQNMSKEFINQISIFTVKANIHLIIIKVCF